MEQRFPVNAAHAQLLKDPEVFDAVIVLLNEKDPDKDVGVPGVIPAVNAASAIALMNVFRFAMRPRVKGYFMSRRRDGQLVAVVQASDFVAMVEKGIAPEAPKDLPEKPPRLDFWDLTQVQPEKPMTDPMAKQFVAEMVIDGVVEKKAVSGVNKESVIGLLTQVTCEKLPRIAGWNLFDDRGELVASVPAVEFIGHLADKTGLSKRPADPRTAGFNVMPMVTGTSEEFVEMMNKAKKEGRTPSGK